MLIHGFKDYQSIYIQWIIHNKLIAYLLNNLIR